MFLRLIEELLNCPSNIVKDLCTAHVLERLGIILLGVLHLAKKKVVPTTQQPQCPGNDFWENVGFQMRELLKPIEMTE